MTIIPDYTADFRPEAVILANGDFPTHEVPLAVLHTAAYLCCCDGAFEELLAHGIVPDAVVGDGDSLSPQLKQRCQAIYHQIDEQDYNDLTKATLFCRSKGFTQIAYLGATGKREDHALGNISLLSTYHETFGLQPVMLTDYGSFVAMHGNCSLATFPHQQVSIFNLSCKHLDSQGLRWPSYPFSALWQGTLNEAIGTTISFEADGSMLIYRTYGAKVSTK